MSSGSDPRYVESKIDGSVLFALPEEGPFKPIGNHHPALIHLVEFRVDKDFVAWFGVADVACDILQVTRDATAAGMAAVPEGHARDLMDYRMQITLADGRVGSATTRATHGDYTAEGEHHRVEFTGMSDLKAPDGRRGGPPADVR